MTDAMLAAVTRAVALKRGVYTWAEALETAAMENNLDEFQTEDLAVIAKGQYLRLMEQTGGF